MEKRMEVNAKLSKRQQWQRVRVKHVLFWRALAACTSPFSCHWWAWRTSPDGQRWRDENCLWPPLFFARSGLSPDDRRWLTICRQQLLDAADIAMVILSPCAFWRPSQRIRVRECIFMCKNFNEYLLHRFRSKRTISLNMPSIFYFIWYIIPA